MGLMDDYPIGYVIWNKTKASNGSYGWEHRESDGITYWEAIKEDDLERLKAKGIVWPGERND